MHTHDVDLTSLTWGIVLVAITALLALSIWTNVLIDLGVVIPAALICTGGLVLIAALVRRPQDAGGDDLGA